MSVFKRDTGQYTALSAARHGPRLRAAARLLPWLAWTVCVLLLVGCARAPAEQRLREALSGLQNAIEAREVGQAIDFVADDFIGRDGLDREGARGLLRLQVIRHQQLGLSFGPYEITLQGERATVRFTAVATGGSGAMLPESARVWQVETGWREEQGQWRLISADWK
jgi:hypothetical protein